MNLNWRRMGRMIYATTMLGTALMLAVNVFLRFITHPQINGQYRVMFIDMIYGHAFRPFVTRVLLPLLVRMVTALLPAAWKSAIIASDLRLQLLRAVRALLAPQGRFILSNWQFLNSDKLRARLQPWTRIGLTEEDVDAGDYLLDWRRGGEGLRYAHQFSEAELAALAAECDFDILETFHSDGEGGRLGLYQVWNPRG